MGTITTGYKTPDKSAVKQYAESMMSKQSAVTTLEIKNAMRADNYWIDQKDVSRWLREIASENNWDHSNATGPYGTYIVYSKQVVTTPAATTTTSISNQNPTDKGMVESIITKLFGIHKYAMNDASVLGKDLGLTDKLDLEELSSAIEADCGKDIDITSAMTILDIKNSITSDKATPSGRVKINIDPKMDFKNGVTNDELKDLIKDGKLSDEDWVLSVGIFSSRLVYSGNESRDHVRTAFARKVGVHINTTRASRVKTLLDHKKMTNNQREFDKVIGKSKVSSVLPLLQTVADEHDLKLNRANDFKQARALLMLRSIKLLGAVKF